MAQPGLDQTLVAPANPTKRAILLRLVESDARITALTRPFPISLNSVSKYIRVLEWAHGVRRHRVGQEHILFLCPEPLMEAARSIEP